MKPTYRAESECVLITGLGPVTCFGFGLEDLVAGVSEATVLHSTAKREQRDARTIRCIPDFDLSEFVDPPPSEEMSPHTRCALVAGVLALDSAAVEPDEVKPENCGLTFATAGRTFAAFHANFDADGAPVLLAEELWLRGFSAKFSGGLLCGAQALLSAFQALKAGTADLLLVGGSDVLSSQDLLLLTRYAMPDAPPLAQAAAGIILETEDSVERREGFAFCELGSVVCLDPHGAQSAAGLAEALRTAIDQAIQQAGAWVGDISSVFVCSGGTFCAEAAQAEAEALASFSQVTIVTAKQFVGETFAAGFLMECILAADMLNNGLVPSKIVFEGKRKGVEIWMEKQSETMVGDSILVVGCSMELVAAAVLRAL